MTVSRRDGDIVHGRRYRGGRKYMDGRKGIISFNFITYIPRLVFLVVVLIACIILIRMFLMNKVDVKDVQAEVLITGLMYGKGGISYYDELTGRNYPEIIDISSVGDLELENAYNYPGNRLMTAKMTVLDRKGNELKVFYYNQEWYDKWQPLVKLKGIGGVTHYERKMPVIYKESPEAQPKLGYIVYEVIQPRG
jgi:hypothetical protein